MKQHFHTYSCLKRNEAGEVVDPPVVACGPEEFPVDLLYSQKRYEEACANLDADVANYYFLRMPAEIEKQKHEKVAEKARDLELALCDLGNYCTKAEWRLHRVLMSFLED